MLNLALKLLPTILALIQELVRVGVERKAIEHGRLVEIAQAAQTLNAILARATAARQEAEEAHAKDSTDGAFDADFRRPD